MSHIRELRHYNDGGLNSNHVCEVQVSILFLPLQIDPCFTCESRFHIGMIGMMNVISIQPFFSYRECWLHIGLKDSVGVKSMKTR